MIRAIAAATLLVAAGAATPPAAQAQLVDCRASGKLEITRVSRTRPPSSEGGGLVLNVLVTNRQATRQSYIISYNGSSRTKVINQERTLGPNGLKVEWVATLNTGVVISDQQVFNNISLLCY